MSNGSRAPMKVVIINTQYVETDAMSFKSVVQRLTGKDATVEIDPPAQKQQHGSKSGLEMANNGAMFSRGMSFKEFDLLLKELPPLEELYRIYAD